MPGMTAEGRERRRTRRFQVELSVAFRHLGRPEENFAELARNISEGGVFIETSVGLPIGTPLALEILGVPGGRPITIEGEVVRVEWNAGNTGSTIENGERGLAVEFRPGQDGLRALIRHIEAELALGLAETADVGQAATIDVGSTDL